jgi:hypothetical protein
LLIFLAVAIVKALKQNVPLPYTGSLECAILNRRRQRQSRAYDFNAGPTMHRTDHANTALAMQTPPWQLKRCADNVKAVLTMPRLC